MSYKREHTKKLSLEDQTTILRRLEGISQATTLWKKSREIYTASIISSSENGQSNGRC
jgi:hypothetical protein